MANNDKLKQIISNLQVLTDLTNSMIDSEMYPVSFFSQAFDLIQKIQSDVHTLEADQVELFAAQMKKHQTLILSIHQQMRNISPDVPEQKPITPVNTVRPDNSQKPAINQTTNKSSDTPEQKESKSKKTSFLGRLGIHPPSQSAAPSKKQTEMPASSVNKEKPTSVTIEEPIKVPVKKPVPPANKSTTETVVEKKTEKSAPVNPQTSQNKETEKKPVVAPPVTTPPAKKNMQPTGVGIGTETTNQTEKSTEVKKPKPTPTEVNTVPSLKEVIEKKKLSDLRKAFSLNDRFLYRRELFGGSEEAMNKVIAILNSKESFKESVDFLDEKLHWDFSDPTVKDFVKILEIRFL